MKFALKLIAVTMLGLSISAASAVTPNPAPEAQESNSAAPVQKREGPPSLFDEGKVQAQQQVTAFLDVQIKVPHKTHPKDAFNIYPYPVKPPTAQHPAELPTKEKDMKQQLLATGYILRSSHDKAYQPGGWRWQYCYKAAARKSGLGVPHNIFSEYAWVRDISPYMAEECKRWNAFEDQRWKRYEKARADYERNRADAESEAVQQGLYPMEVPRRGYGWGQVNLPPGSWWLTCTRKVPGLTYYWQIPMTAAPGEKIKIELTEMNALVIEGGW